jgi:hypothetical protein
LPVGGGHATSRPGRPLPTDGARRHTNLVPGREGLWPLPCGPAEAQAQDMEATSSFGAQVVNSRPQVNSLPDSPLSGLTGVTHRVLWADGTSRGEVLTVESGHRLSGCVRPAAHHEVWVLVGRAAILGVEVGVGSSVHVPAGVSYDIDAVATGGCTVIRVERADDAVVSAVVCPSPMARVGARAPSPGSPEGGRTPTSPLAAEAAQRARPSGWPLERRLRHRRRGRALAPLLSQVS